MRLTWRFELIQLLIIAAMFAAAAWCWSRVPDQLPVHWNFQGQADRFGGKFEGLLGVPLLAVGVYTLLIVAPLFDPGRRNYQNFARAYNIIRLTIVLFMAVIYTVMLRAAFGYQPNMSSSVLLAVALLFAVLGNVMSKIRPNWFVGVRTPWTLSSKLSWDKTHRLAGWLFMFMGGLFALLALVQTGWMFATVMVLDGLCLVWMFVYSYLVFRRDPDRTPPAATSPGTE